MVAQLYDNSVSCPENLGVCNLSLFVGLESTVFEDGVGEPWHGRLALSADDSVECCGFECDGLAGTLYAHSKLPEPESMYKERMGCLVVYSYGEALAILHDIQCNGFGEVCGGAIMNRASMKHMGGGMLLQRLASGDLWHMAGDTALFGVSLFDLQVTNHEAIATLFVRVTPHAALSVIVVFIAIVDIMVGGAGGFAKQTKKALLLLENYPLSLFCFVCGEKIFLFISVDIFVRFGMLLYTLDLMAGLAGDGFTLLDRIVCECCFS